MSLKLVSISLYNIKEHCEASRSHVEFAPGGIDLSLQYRVWACDLHTCWQYMRARRGLGTSPWSRFCPCQVYFLIPPPGRAIDLNERLKRRRKYYLFLEYYTWWAEKSSLWPAMNWAHFLINLIASMLVSGKAALHANSERHLIASWKMKDQISLNAWADRKYLERVHHGCELGFKHLCDNFTRCLRKNKLMFYPRTISKNLKSELNNILILVRCCYVKDRKDISPSRLDVVPLQKQ